MEGGPVTEGGGLGVEGGPVTEGVWCGRNQHTPRHTLHNIR